MGRLAMDAGRALFEYNPEFLKLGLDVSPFRLPPRPGTIEGDRRIFDPCTACSPTACRTAGACCCSGGSWRR